MEALVFRSTLGFDSTIHTRRDLPYSDDVWGRVGSCRVGNSLPRRRKHAVMMRWNRKEEGRLGFHYGGFSDKIGKRIFGVAATVAVALAPQVAIAESLTVAFPVSRAREVDMHILFVFLSFVSFF